MLTSRGGWVALAGVVLLGSSFSYSYNDNNKKPSTTSKSAAKRFAAVDAARLTSADEKDPGNWLSYGRTYNEMPDLRNHYFELHMNPNNFIYYMTSNSYIYL